MSAITQNRKGTITLTDGFIKQSVIGYVKSFTSTKLIDVEIKQNEINRFVFTLFLKDSHKENFTSELDALCTYVSKMVRTNLQIYGSIIIAQITN
ncbi:MAG: hypothetical protein LBF00_01575 [Mycoplasmataceae bacterium]|jgi:hypothetical protein|nr:hypothetical protein [Mycoplasmataceae bacterium]